jgi:hypothetical protein
MAGKPKNRLELRRQYEAAEPLDPMEDEGDDIAEEGEEEESERKTKKKPKAPSKSKTKAAKPAARMRVVWNVVNDAFKPVATFEYADKDAAHARAAELTAKGKGTHFVQRVKEPMPEGAPGLGQQVATELAAAKAAPAKPARAAKSASKSAKKPKAGRPDDDEEIEEEEPDEEEEEEEEEEDEE